MTTQGGEMLDEDVAWTPRTKTAAAQLRSVLRANLMDGDEGGSLTMRCSELLNEVCELVVETWLPDIIAQARADGIEEGRGDMEHLERKWRAEARAEGAAEERAKWKWLDEAQMRLAGKYTYAPGPGGNLDRIARLSAEDLRPVVEEWIKSHYRAMDAARGIPS